MRNLKSPLLKSLCVTLSLFSSIEATHAGPIHEFVLKGDLHGLSDYISEKKPNYKEFMRQNRRHATPLALAKALKNKRMYFLVATTAKFLSWNENASLYGNPIKHLVSSNCPLSLALYLTYHPVNYDEFMDRDPRSGITVIDVAFKTKDPLMIDLVRDTANYLLSEERVSHDNPVVIQSVLTKIPDAPSPQFYRKKDEDKPVLADSSNLFSGKALAHRNFVFDDEEDLQRGLSTSIEN